MPQIEFSLTRDLRDYCVFYFVSSVQSFNVPCTLMLLLWAFGMAWAWAVEKLAFLVQSPFILETYFEWKICEWINSPDRVRRQSVGMSTTWHSKTTRHKAKTFDYLPAANGALSSIQTNFVFSLKINFYVDYARVCVCTVEVACAQIPWNRGRWNKIFV